MDGRRIRRWWLSGCLVVGALGCSNRNTVQPPFNSAQPISGVPMASKPKSFWNGLSSKSAAPVEVSAEVDSTAQAKPDTHAILANAQVDSAFNEETPPASREALLDQARQGYQRALKLDAKNKPALLGLAKYYVRLNEREKAIETYKRYFGAYPKDKDVAHEVAMAHAQWKDWAGATAWCEFALKIDPENLSIRKTMAFCLARAGKWDEGFAVMCQVMPEAQARYLMARVLEHQNQPDASRMQLQLALQADPAYIPAREFLVELDQSTRPTSAPAQNPIITVGGTEQNQ
jgi:thioredoxin-like negative regulator of GroEL